MPHLDVQFDDGRRDSRTLSRSSPLSIGAQSFNDVCIPGSDVGPLHCRIGWNKSGYEVTAATSRGVDLNGTVVEHAFLKPGDILRIGAAEITYQADPPAAKSPPVEKPVEKPPDKTGKEKPSRKPDPAADMSLFEGPVLTESMADLALAEDDEPVAVSEDELPTLTRSREVKPAATTGVVAKVGRELQGGRQRPGEQEIFRSPMILGLAGGGIVLLLVSATIYFLMGRESATRLFDTAASDLGQGRYTQAIENFEQFVALYPRHSQTELARINIGKARIQRELFGGAPAWSAAWERLNEFVREFRNAESYRELRPIVQDYAEQIALGAAKSAETTKDGTLIAISDEARLLLERTADQETPINAVLDKIKEATAKAQAAIHRQGERNKAVANMQAAIADGRAIDALSERDRLLRAHPLYRDDRGLQTVLNEALAQAKSTVKPLEVAAATALPDEPAALHSVLPVFHQRSRTDEASLGQTVWLLAQDSCYAVDTITGEVVWRRVIGPDPAFAPVVTRGAQPGWLVFDRRRSELLHCRADNGDVLWRCPLPAAPSGGPLVEQNQIYLTTRDRKLLRIDLGNGEVTAGLLFAQEVSGPPTVNATNDHLFLAGARGLIYAVGLRPLECVAVTFTDHAEGAVAAPLVALGQLLLVCQNDRPNESTLRVYNATEPARPLPVVDTHEVAGAVFDPPVLRGPQLVVPSQGERLTAFVVNDDPGRMELSRIGDYRVQDGYGGPIRVMLGPDQQFWMSSTAFRRFQIMPDSLQMGPTPVAVGLTSQPLQAVGETFFVGRRMPFGEAVHFTNVDRNSMTGTWRTAVGGQPRALLTGGNGPVVQVTESGLVFTVGGTRLASGGTEMRGGFSLELPATLTEPLLIGALHDGRAVIAAGGDVNRCWVVEANGRVGAPFNLSESLQRPPVLLDAGLILPLPERLQVRPLSGNARYAEWRAPADANASATWVHVLRTSTDECLAADSNGRWRELKIEPGDVPHLAEVAHADYAPPAAIAPVLLGESVLIADIEHVVRKLSVRGLNEQAKREFDRSVRGMASLDERSALVWDDRQLRAIDVENGLKDRWTTELNGLVPVGKPVVRDGHLVLGCRDGTVLTLDAATGAQVTRTTVPQMLSLGVVSLQNTLWAAACDGTLYRLDESAAKPVEGQP